MRIGIVTGEYPPMQGGVGAYTQVLAHTFIKHGHQVFVFSSNKTHDSELDLTNSIKKWTPRSLRAVKQWAKRKQLDIISLQFETAAFGMSPWIHFLPDVVDVPVVVTFHDLLVPYLFPKAGQLREWIVMRLAKACAGVIVTNHEDFQRIPESTLVPIGSNIITNPPPDFNREVWRNRAGVEPNGYLLAYFGFINHSKGVDTLLGALGKLREDGLPFKLVMIGGKTGTSDPSNAVYAEKIDILTKRMGLEPHIYWTGFVKNEEVSGFLRSSDVVVLPFRDGASYRRGSLMAAIEHGCAIVTTQPQVDIPTFQDRGNMLLVPPDDSDAIVKAIKHLITNPTLRYHVITGAAELNRYFNWDNIAQSYLDVFKHTL